MFHLKINANKQVKGKCHYPSLFLSPNALLFPVITIWYYI